MGPGALGAVLAAVVVESRPLWGRRELQNASTAPRFHHWNHHPFVEFSMPPSATRRTQPGFHSYVELASGVRGRTSTPIVGSDVLHLPLNGHPMTGYYPHPHAHSYSRYAGLGAVAFPGFPMGMPGSDRLLFDHGSMSAMGGFRGGSTDEHLGGRAAGGALFETTPGGSLFSGQDGHNYYARIPYAADSLGLPPPPYTKLNPIADGGGQG